MNKVHTKIPYPEKGADVSTQFKELLDQILVPATQRINIQQIRSNKWINGLQTTKITVN